MFRITCFSTGYPIWIFLGTGTVLNSIHSATNGCANIQACLTQVRCVTLQPPTKEWCTVMWNECFFAIKVPLIIEHSGLSGQSGLSDHWYRNISQRWEWEVKQLYSLDNTLVLRISISQQCILSIVIYSFSPPISTFRMTTLKQAIHCSVI